MSDITVQIVEEVVQIIEVVEKGDTGATGPEGPPGADATPLTKEQVEDPNDSVNFGTVSGERLSQSIIAWGARKLSEFKGVLKRYTEEGASITITAGAGSFDWAASENIRNVPALTQNTVITITGTLTTLKPVTLSTVPDTGGPWTLSYIANGKTKLLTRNGSGTADLETFELWSDGVDVFTIEAGGTIWSKGA